jgi:hypothetical protein
LNRLGVEEENVEMGNSGGGMSLESDAVVAEISMLLVLEEKG